MDMMAPRRTVVVDFDIIQDAPGFFTWAKRMQQERFGIVIYNAKMREHPLEKMQDWMNGQLILWRRKHRQDSFVFSFAYAALKPEAWFAVDELPEGGWEARELRPEVIADFPLWNPPQVENQEKYVFD
jgi:hypothetical protein